MEQLENEKEALLYFLDAIKSAKADKRNTKEYLDEINKKFYQCLANFAHRCAKVSQAMQEDRCQVLLLGVANLANRFAEVSQDSK